MNIAITGHQQLPTELWAWVGNALFDKISGCGGSAVTGWTSLAPGTDQLFAEVILRIGATLRVVLPFAEYESIFDSVAGRQRFEVLLKASSETRVLADHEDREQSYLAAGQYLVDHCELVVAVWDGKPARGVGGTADIVCYSRRSETPVYVIDPFAQHSYLIPT